MSAGAALQDLIHATLIGSTEVTGHVGARIYDNPPPHPAYPYISFGPCNEFDDGAECIDGQEITFQIDIWTSEGGSKRGCKVIAGAVRRVLRHTDLSLPDPYALAQLRVPQARVMDDPEPGIVHGVVQVEAMVEE